MEDIFSKDKDFSEYSALSVCVLSLGNFNTIEGTDGLFYLISDMAENVQQNTTKT